MVKKDAETGAVVKGATFGLYAKEDILAGEEVIVKAGTLLSEAVTGEDGRAVFDCDLPFGTYKSGNFLLRQGMYLLRKFLK